MCDPILVTVLKMQPHYSQSSRENATPSSGTSPVASYKEVPPPPPRALYAVLFYREKDEKPFARSVWLGVKIPSTLTDVGMGQFTKTMGHDNLK